MFLTFLFIPSSCSHSPIFIWPWASLYPHLSVIPLSLFLLWVFVFSFSFLLPGFSSNSAQVFHFTSNLHTWAWVHYDLLLRGARGCEGTDVSGSVTSLQMGPGVIPEFQATEFSHPEEMAVSKGGFWHFTILLSSILSPSLPLNLQELPEPELADLINKYLWIQGAEEHSAISIVHEPLRGPHVHQKRKEWVVNKWLKSLMGPWIVRNLACMVNLPMYLFIWKNCSALTWINCNSLSPRGKKEPSYRSTFLSSKLGLDSWRKHSPSFWISY